MEVNNNIVIPGPAFGDLFSKYGLGFRGVHFKKESRSFWYYGPENTPCKYYN